MKPINQRTQERLLMLAGALGLAGLATALLYVLNSTPYTMVLFMGGGIGMLAGAMVLLAVAILSEVRSRLSSMKSNSFERGEVICRQGEAAEFMYVITEGEVSFTAEQEGKPSIELGQLGPADYFGDMAILSDTPYQTTAKAYTDVRLLTIHRRDFQSMYTHLPNLREQVQREQQRKRSLVEQATSQHS